ncbi:MAG: hypothetical protein BA861_10025 [Desulfobacterales bacterium S3730MH5]|nr:MAG: hypothetical protein BA861_10025 [Desulfobacterales bacterium S3730MH5]
MKHDRTAPKIVSVSIIPKNPSALYTSGNDVELNSAIRNPQSAIGNPKYYSIASLQLKNPRIENYKTIYGPPYRYRMDVLLLSPIALLIDMACLLYQ